MPNEFALPLLEKAAKDFFKTDKIGYETFWTDQLLKRMKLGNKYVIPDMRFPVEMEAVKWCGGVSAMIVADQKTCEKRLTLRDGGFDPNIWDSISENSFQSMQYDIVVENTGKDIEMYLDFCLGMDQLKEKTYYEVLNASI